MKEIGNHPNVVRMLGCCTKGQDIALVMEYFPHGNLKDYLVNHRPKLAVSHINKLTNEQKQHKKTEIEPVLHVFLAIEWLLHLQRN